MPHSDGVESMMQVLRLGNSSVVSSNAVKKSSLQSSLLAQTCVKVSETRVVGDLRCEEGEGRCSPW
jgi:hypothetical protein